MKTLRLQTQITSDGKLVFDLPCELPPGPADVVIMVQSKNAPASPPFDTLAGLFAGQLADAADTPRELREIRRVGKTRSVVPFIGVAILLIIAGIAVAVWINYHRTILARETLATPDGTLVFTIEEHARAISFCANRPDSHRSAKMVVATPSKAESERSGTLWIPREGYDPLITIDTDRQRVHFEIGSAHLYYDVMTNQFLMR